ncbi:MAG: hypothetical protein EXR99_07150 [Gemmataceae bacterium]|nr:hypothetical protein [Gemmataceae bacterium]
MTLLPLCVFLNSLLPLQGVDIAPPGLGERPTVDEITRVEIHMALSGEMKFSREGKPSTLAVKAEAKHTFAEKVLALKNGLPVKVARHYEIANANFTLDGEKSVRSLRKDRQILVAQRPENELTVYCPNGALTREELELTSEHFDTMALAGLLPGKEVKQGESWKIPNEVVQALCNFEGLAEHTLTGKVESKENGILTLVFLGIASGVEGGASVKSAIKAVGKFDESLGKITELQWGQEDEREQGPLNPASKTRLNLKLSRKKIVSSTALADAALVAVPQGFRVPNLLSYVEYRDGNGRFELTMARDWQVVAKTENHLVLRLVEKGDFIGQATISQWSKALPGKHISPTEFRAVAERTPGWLPEKVLQEGEVPGVEGGKWIFRIAAMGLLDGVPTMQIFYLIAGPGGEQLVATFSLPPKQAEKLGTKDLSLVGSIEIPAGGKK